MKILKYNSVKFAFIITVLHAITEVIPAYLFTFLVVDSYNELIQIVSIILLVYIINAILLQLRLRSSAVANYYLSMNLNQKISKHFSNKSYCEFMKKNSGEHASLYVNDVPKIINLIFDKSISLISKIVVAICAFIALLKIHYTMIFVALISILILFITPIIFEKKLSQYIIQGQEAKQKFLNEIRELLQGFAVFLENHAFSCFLKKSSQASYEYANSICHVDIFAGIMSAVLTFVNSILTLTALTVIAYLVYVGKVSSGAFLAILSLMPSFCQGIMEFMSEKTFYKSGLELYNKKLAYIDTNNSNNKIYTRALFKKNFKNIDYNIYYESENEKILTIEIKDLQVKYNEKILKFPDNIRFDNNKKYAIIGPSGSGKSTLLKVIIGEINDYNGNIFINDKIKDKNKTLFNNIAYFNQNTYLFNDTLKNNILLDRILCKIVRIPLDKRGNYTAFQLFKKCTVNIDKTGERYVEIDGHDDALPLMFEFKSKFFTYQLWNALRLKSSNQLRMYEI